MMAANLPSDSRMNLSELENLLHAIRAGNVSVETGLERLRTLPFEDVGVALIDHHRELRQGAPEVVLGEGKSGEQLLTIVGKMVERGSNILVTRLAREKAAPLLARFPGGEYDADGRTFILVQTPIEPRGRGKIVVVCAGTSDIPVVREASVTARMLGNEVEEVIDVGVAGLHRLLARLDRCGRRRSSSSWPGWKAPCPRWSAAWWACR